MNAHPTAVIDPAAEIGGDVEIGPYSIIEAGARIADGCRIGPHVHIEGDVEIGENCFVGKGAILGADPQSVDFDKSTPTGLTIGPENEIREYVTIHRSMLEGQRTRVGTKNFIMTGAHFGHDCLVGDENVIANNCLLAGHVELGNRCFLGGGSVFHQFIRIGDFVITQGNSGFSLDLPPFLVGARVNRVAGMNVVGLKRGGFSPEERKEIKAVFRAVLRSEKILSEALQLAAESDWCPAAQQFLDFFQTEKPRKYCLQWLKKADD
ncbi:MAG: acyl-ACP--UDP-N-acetylglucosamine O-acyltransferase [Verrucomicrobiales bacterium]|nr:acyl-ACP--UDP-N-acetylglucosamine O-acyltransferase [Verrucomicrobiales bacterium]